MPSRPPPPEARPSLIGRVRDLLAEPRLRGCNLDGPERIALHRAILRSKPALRRVFTQMYLRCLEVARRAFVGTGPSIEIGAGTSLFHDLAAGLVSTDFVFDRELDVAADALRLPFRNGTLHAVFAINCFHHLPDPSRFLRELERALAPGGGCVVIDPYYGPFARLFYRYVFAQETFDKTQRDWANPDGDDRAMSGANQALSYIVFVRDRDRLEMEHPRLEVVHHEVLSNYASYLLSGGLNFRSVLPAAWTPLYALVDLLFRPFRAVLGLHHLFVLRKRPET